MAPMDLRGKVALVTGSATRVGAAIARALASRGARVAVHYRSSRDAAHRVREACAAAAGTAEAFRADLAAKGEPDRLVREVAAGLGPIDVLVNNAANFRRTPIDSVSEADWDFAMDLNLKAPFLLSLQVGRAMRARGAGKIVNLVDWAARRPYRHYLPYCVSKAGLLSLTEILAKELAPQVTVNAVAPGPVLMPDDFGEEERQRVLRRVPLGRLGAPEDVVAAVLFLLEGTDFATGTCVAVDGGQGVV